MGVSRVLRSMQPLDLKLAFPLLLCAAAHGATLLSLVQTRFKLHAGSALQRVQKESVSVLSNCDV